MPKLQHRRRWAAEDILSSIALLQKLGRFTTSDAQRPKYTRPFIRQWTNADTLIGLQNVVLLSSDLSALPVSGLPTKIGADHKMYYYFKFEIRVQFFSAHIGFSLWYDGKRCGSVEAEYV